MEFVYIAVFNIIVVCVLAVVFGVNVKRLKAIAENKELDNLADKYPDNLEICKSILKKLNNENVKIEENKESQTSLYIALTNKITIANVRGSFSRIQTIAHECLHSIQDRKILMFNFVFSNIYLLAFVLLVVLDLAKLLPSKMMFLCMYLLMGFVYFVVRAYLENDAMIKARFLAKDYMQEQEVSSKEEIERIVDGFDQINNLGIKCVNYSLAQGVLIKTAIVAIIFAIF